MHIAVHIVLDLCGSTYCAGGVDPRKLLEYVGAQVAIRELESSKSDFRSRTCGTLGAL